MAYSYTFPNTSVEFKNLNNTPSSGQFGTKHGSNNDFQYADEDGIQPFVNAVEIDWNAAQLGELTISNNCESHCSMIVPFIAA